MNTKNEKTEAKDSKKKLNQRKLVLLKKKN